MKFSIFPISWYKENISWNDELKKKYIPRIEDSLDDLIIPETWLTNNVKTSILDKDLNQSILDKSLLDTYGKIISKFFTEEVSILIYQPWFNHYTNGEWQEQHTHCGTIDHPIHFACIHYLQYDPKIHSALVVEDPNSTMRKYVYQPPEYYSKIKFDISEGDLVMIPSYLGHEVAAGDPTPDYPRITISFNVRVSNPESKKNIIEGTEADEK